MFPKQRQVVVALPEPYGCTLLTELLHSAVGRQQGTDPSACLQVAETTGGDGRDPIQLANELLGSLPLLPLDLNQLLFSSLVNRRHSFQKHLGHIVPGRHSHAADETEP